MSHLGKGWLWHVNCAMLADPPTKDACVALLDIGVTMLLQFHKFDTWLNQSKKAV